MSCLNSLRGRKQIAEDLSLKFFFFNLRLGLELDLVFLEL